jgi:hypothetical protein
MLVSFGIINPSRSADPDTCPEARAYYGNLEVHRLYVNYSRLCSLSVRIRGLQPKGANREYYFGQNGHFGIHSGLSFPGAKESKATAGREFAIPPGGHNATYKWDPVAKTLDVVSSSGTVFKFSEEKKSLISISGVKFIESPDVRLERSSFRIIQTDRPITDWGWARGTYPSYLARTKPNAVKLFQLQPGQDYSNFIGVIDPAYLRGTKDLFTVPPLPPLRSRPVVPWLSSPAKGNQ